MVIRKIKLLITLSFIWVLSVSFCDKEKDLLLVYAVCDGNFELNIVDASWINSDIKLTIKIDTINTKYLKYFKGNKQFLYRNHIFNQTQLYELNELDKVKDVSIKSHRLINKTGPEYTPSIGLSSNEFVSPIQIKLLKEYMRYSKSNNKEFEFYFFDIVTENGLLLNEIRCLIIP